MNIIKGPNNQAP